MEKITILEKMRYADAMYESSNNLNSPAPVCPKCNQGNLDRDSPMKMRYNCIWIFVSCLDCKFSFKEIFEFTNIGDDLNE